MSSRTITYSLTFLSLLPCLLLAAESNKSAPAATSVALPGGKDGIGFDDLGFASSLGKILAPGGRTGNLYLIDHKTRHVDVIEGFSASAGYTGGHGEGITSADEGGSFLFVIDRTSMKLSAIDPKAKKIVASTTLSGPPDYVRFVYATSEVWVTEPQSKQIEVFSLSEAPSALKHVAFISVPGGPESLVIDASRGRAYTHLWTDSTLAIDLKSRAVVAKWKNGCSASRGIALDEARGFLFTGCDEGKATVLDVAHDGKMLGSARSGSGVDIIGYSSKRAHLYLPGATSATLAVIEVADKGSLSVLGMINTAPGAHCGAADQLGNIWVCDPDHGRLLLFHDTWRSAR